MKTQIFLKRAYEAPATSDGFRVLVDRLWPRGLTHEEVPYALWEKNLAPSDELREWFHVDRDARWDQFKEKYAKELEASPAMKEFVKVLSSHPVVTFIYGSKDTIHNQAVIIKNVADDMLAKLQKTA